MKSTTRSECFFPSLVDCTTARHLWRLIQNRTGRTKETKLPHWFADYMRRLQSCLTIAAGVLSKLFRPSILCDPGYVRSLFTYVEPNLKQVFVPNWRLYNLWGKTLNEIIELVFFIFFMTALQNSQFEFVVTKLKKLSHLI